MTSDAIVDSQLKLPPQIFTIETTLGCDLRCPECAIGGGFIKRPKGVMTFEQFKIIADKIRPFAKHVYLHNWGEPLLNPDIFKIIHYTAQFASSNISTNGMSMTRDKAEALITSGVTDIIVSIDGVTQTTYEQYRVGGDVQKAFNALAILSEINNNHGGKVNIMPQFVVFQHNQHEMEEFAQHCSALGRRPTFKAPYIRNVDSRFKYCDNRAFQRPHFSTVGELQSAMRDCPNSRDVFTVLMDGSVLACCHDYAGTSSFGNLFQQNVLEIWNSTKYVQFRRAILSGNAPEFCVENCMTWFMDESSKTLSHGCVQENPENLSVKDDEYSKVLGKLNPTPESLKFLQVHTFYPSYLNNFYSRYPHIAGASFDAQISALVQDCFSGIHIFAPYMTPMGYQSHFIVANNLTAQAQWLAEQGVFSLPDINDWVNEIVRRQIEIIKPDILYLSDPITFDSRFVRSLSWKPRLVLGWRAANIAPSVDWSEFDVMLSSLSALRKVALELGAKASEHFFPGYPRWINDEIATVQPEYDVVFSGSWTTNQHARRNQYLQHLAKAAAYQDTGFSCGFFINCPQDLLPAEVNRYNHGERFGVAMHAALRSGRIVVDARGVLEYCNPITNAVTDLAERETANMRIFEVTGSGRLLLTEYYDNLKEYFEPGIEIETFCNETELVEKIHYYLANPEKREQIARRGQERCLREYSMEKRAAELDRIVRSHLDAKAISLLKPTADVNDIKIKAAQLLKAGDTSAAFELLVQAKALKQPLEGLDLLRAHCFMQMNQPLGAIEALREELRWFPGKKDAEQMLAELLKMIPERAVESLGDAEFQQLLVKIRPYTMISEQRLYSLYSLAKHICESNIPGNFVECGVAAGGSSALLAYVIKHHSKSPRRLFSFDSFSGMPQPTELDSHQGIDAESTGWGTGTCSAPEECVREICAKLGVSDLVTTVKGYFEETLPSMRDWVGMVALLHLDGDWYESTKSILDNLYDRLANNAILQVDDYGYWDGCRKALHEFEANRQVHFSITPIDGTGVWFEKPDVFALNPALPITLVNDFLVDDPAPMGIISQMSVNERFQLYYALRTLLPVRRQPLRFIEIGSFSGASLVLTCQALRGLGVQFQGISVEPGGTPQFHEVVKLLQQDVIHVPMFSYDASLRLKDMFEAGNLPEFIFVDGDHTYEGVRKDIIDYYPFLAPGGIMLFHDYLPPLDTANRAAIFHHHGNAEPGIRQACQEVMEHTYGCEVIDLPLLYPSDPTQTQPQLPIIPGVFSTVRAYRKPER